MALVDPNQQFLLSPELQAGIKGKAKGRHRPGEMNRWEQDYAEHLGKLLAVGAVQWFAFEPIKLKLADKTTYSPDFLVLAQDSVLECHEVKSFWQEDSRVKIKVAAAMFPFRFKAAFRKNQRDAWKMEEF
jgi:hypothetical protein